MPLAWAKGVKMSLVDILEKITVTPVTPGICYGVTEKTELNQQGYPGYLGYPEKHRCLDKNLVRCSDCSHFTGKWCSDRKQAWNGRALQSPDEPHSCRGFHAGQHTPEAIPEATSAQMDIFRAMLLLIETGRLPFSLWPKVSRYLKRKLPPHLFSALQELVEDQGETPTPQTKEWLSPYPARCLDCSRREGCKRTERVVWGLLCRHDCPEYTEEVKEVQSKTTGIIYRPKGAAGEYSPLAVNLYDGCLHGCKYCYVPPILRKDRLAFHRSVLPRDQVLERLQKDALKWANSMEPVLMCFTCDPYPVLEHDITREAIQTLIEQSIPVHVLTKGGTRATRDFDLLARHPKSEFAVTLTCDNDRDSMAWEPGAASPGNRIEALKLAKDAGLKTWVSFEPVLYPEQVSRLIDKSLPFVDEYRVGKLNHHTHAKSIDWRRFLADVTRKLEASGKPFVIKKDLAAVR